MCYYLNGLVWRVFSDVLMVACKPGFKGLTTVSRLEDSRAKHRPAALALLLLQVPLTF